MEEGTLTAKGVSQGQRFKGKWRKMAVEAPEGHPARRKGRPGLFPWWGGQKVFPVIVTVHPSLELIWIRLPSDHQCRQEKLIHAPRLTQLAFRALCWVVAVTPIQRVAYHGKS